MNNKINKKMIGAITAITFMITGTITAMAGSNVMNMITTAKTFDNYCYKSSKVALNAGDHSVRFKVNSCSSAGYMLTESARYRTLKPIDYNDKDYVSISTKSNVYYQAKNGKMAAGNYKYALSNQKEHFAGSGYTKAGKTVIGQYYVLVQ